MKQKVLVTWGEVEDTKNLVRLLHSKGLEVDDSGELLGRITLNADTYLGKYEYTQEIENGET